MREKLIELIGRVQDEGLDYSDVVCVYKTSNGRLADYLIANGVTIPVRCKDCRHWIERTVDGVDTFHICWFTESLASKNHFCAYGERKDNG